MTTAAGTYNATTNWLGSVTGLVSSSGTQVTSTTYTPYGTPTTTGTPASPIGYAGSYALPDSAGLDDMNARDYNPTTAAFTSVDPALALTDQPYTYASDNPVSATDPSGLITCPSWLALGCGVVAIGSAIGAKIANSVENLANSWWNEWWTNNPCNSSAAAGITGNIGQLARQFGYSQRQIRQAIEAVKQDGLPRGGPVRNPNVVVGEDGEVYPLGPGGQPAEDSIGNILDFLEGFGAF